ncbi:uncharacterized protein ARMOST_21607 [Armillaria ostoyae]|uniref:Uncharacterized protein n=1 Tax=Armillaria ostoyae TaxID=47428 RepID=A0A284SAP7_ARMOS|nr:uncharacterized protein ARMOST_21607 [Armillaria ostoyae]
MIPYMQDREDGAAEASVKVLANISRGSHTLPDNLPSAQQDGTTKGSAKWAATEIILNEESIIILEGLYDVRGEVFFVMYKIGTFLTVMRTSEDPTQYYFFNVDTEILVKLTEHYPTLEAFMAKASLWEGGDAQINSVTPFEVLDYAPEARDLDELTIEWRAALRALA